MKPAPSDAHPDNCPACQHRHLGKTICGHSTARDNLCECKEEPMAKEEPEVGSFVKSAAVKVLDTGEAEGTITIAGTQKALERLIGATVILENGTKKMHGKMVAFSVKDKGGKREATAKVKGARDLDALVGLTVTLTRSQRELPGGEE